jgi:DnaD/phage-associated family protein
MKITPIYKNKIISLPFEIITEKLANASKDELKVILAVFAEPEFEPSIVAEQLDMTEKAFMRALNFWVKNNALSVEYKESGTDPAVEVAVKVKDEKLQKNNKVVIHTSLPHYTSNEAARVIEKTHGFSELLDSCQQVLGKMFNSAETEIIIGLIDHLSLTHDYILLLCQHAANIDKKSVRYIEKMAIDFFDKDILTYPALESELKKIEERNSFEKFIRKMFGMGSRYLIKKERDMISAWQEKFMFSNDIITRAYEITVTKTNEPSINYTNAILEKWYAAGYKTIADIEAAEEKRAKSKNASSSFSVDDIYEAALMRSYNDNK